MFKLIALVALAAASAFAAPTAELSARAGGPTIYNIHPILDNSKCVGIIGGTYGDGVPVDIYDCNHSNTQNWQWYGNSLVSVNVTDLSHWCLDAGNVDQLRNGTQMKIWQCFNNLPQQTWTPVFTAGPIALSVDDLCLDLTNGVTTNRNVLQVWQCAAGNPNQFWNFTSA